MSGLPKVVALTPVWQAEAFVAETLESLAAQTWPNLDILIAVDRSDDRSLEICRAFAEERPNASVHAHEERQGWVGNVNWLLSQADGDLFFFAFHDDVLAPAYVESLARALIDHPKAVLAYSDMETLNLSGDAEISVYTALEGLSAAGRARSLLWRLGDWWAPNRGLFRAEAARAVGGLKRHAAGEFSADWPWLLALALRGPFVRAPGVLCFKRYTKQSLSRGWSFSLKQWNAALSSCAREIRASPLPLKDKLALMLSILSVRRSWLIGALQRRSPQR